MRAAAGTRRDENVSFSTREPTARNRRPRRIARYSRTHLWCERSRNAAFDCERRQLNVYYGCLRNGGVMRRIFLTLAVAVACSLVSGRAQMASPALAGEIEFTPAQSAEGKTAYDRACRQCHGRDLDDGDLGPPLRGSVFTQNWGGKSVEELFTYASTRMPPDGPGSLGPRAYAGIVAYILQSNGVASGLREMPSTLGGLSPMRIPGAGDGRGVPGGGLTPGIALPNPPPPNTVLDHVAPVTPAILAKPLASEWLTWRRTYDGQGYSPLKQIDRTNVMNLRLAWSWSLPPGPNTATPLEHDGVLFVQGYGDQVEALDAATGDLLWHYQRALPEDVRPGVKKNIAIYGTKIYAATSDVHLIALDVKTGKLVWDTELGDHKIGMQLTGGPIAAKGKIMIGTGGQQPGGNFIIALDAETGREAWRFRTIPLPDERGGNTWNGLPTEKRSGGSSWTSGSYDPDLNLVYFGAAPSYDTGPLRIPSKEPGITNDALYSDATMALNPDTGKLVWYFQHLPNDQWDYDWVFERTLVKLPVNGQMKTLSVTAGKIAIYDAVEADTGKYVFSVDMGLQNIVTAIDPKTGAKTIDPALVPGDGEAKLVCPHTGGGRNWIPTAYNPDTKILYSPLVESCMDLTPVGKGEQGFLSTGVRHSVRPRLDSDGKYGRIQATNLETRKTVWIERERAPITSGILDTAGGLIFNGAIDRWFTARDDKTGKELWRVRLNDIPGSAPITYSVNGKQYVAISVGNGSAIATIWPPLVPEIQNPPGRGGTVWVFELP
jgi:alcohol dehydrogenase (cytochrome c)